MSSDSDRSHFAQKETEELVTIAFLEDSYLPEGKRLAREELARRGFDPENRELIEHVRAENEQMRLDILEERISGFEHQDKVPSWRRAVRT